MEKRGAQGALYFQNEPKLIGRGSIAGEKESEGPLGSLFDEIEPDCHAGCETFEQAESSLQKRAVEHAMRDAGAEISEIDLLFGGDLLNQCSGTAYGIAGFGLPFFSLYGACSTMAESLLLASLAVDGGYASRALAVTSSHFCAAERQFRFPLEYGGQRSQNAQWTVTGSGSVVVADEAERYYARVTAACPGRIQDYGILDASNMGAAMAPAAADTLLRFFEDTGTGPADYDRIITGDLARVGSDLLYRILEKHGVNLRPVHEDCGLLIFDRERQDVHAGGSGCGCCGTVLCAKILPELKRGALKKILFLATGAYMSLTSSKQGEPIMGVAHLLQLESPERED